MGLDPLTIAIAGFALGTAGAVEQRNQVANQRKEMNRANAAQLKQQQIQAQRERRAQVRQARIARANVVARSTAQGTAGTSALSQSTGSITSRTADNIGFLGERESLAASESIFNRRANEAASRASTAGAVSGLGLNIFSQAGGFKSLGVGE